MSILLINTAGAGLKKNTRKNFKISVMLELPFQCPEIWYNNNAKAPFSTGK